MGFIYFNDQNRVRVPLSKEAHMIMEEDMKIFSIKKPSQFINIIIQNFHNDAKSSLSNYLSQVREKYEEIFKDAALDESSRRISIDHIMAHERAKTEKEVNRLKKLDEYKITNGDKKTIPVHCLYYISKDNILYLNSFEDETFYDEKPGSYIKCLVEEYIRLPFIKRARIIKREIFQAVEYACHLNEILKISTNIPGRSKPTTFLVYPYKIVPDPMNTQEYLACYTYEDRDLPQNKITASFSMARLAMPQRTGKTAELSSDDKKRIEKDISELTAAYLLGNPEKIQVALTPRGKEYYQSRLYARPTCIKLEKLFPAQDDIYTFNCSEYQAYHYFFSFGAEAKIIRPLSLYEKMKAAYQNASDKYK